MSFNKIVVLLFIVSISGCGTRNGVVIPPNGGAGITVDKPVWISGIQEVSLKYSKSFPKSQENKFLKVVNAGYWLANTNGKISQLVYMLELNNKKSFSQSKVYVRSYFTNPEDKSNPFTYDGTLDNFVGSTKITHATVNNVELHKEYSMVFEVYSDSNRTNLITKINQKIISPVDNSNGCVKFSDDYMGEIFGNVLDSKGKPIPINKLIINCVRS
jgi:hypothetical protein